MIRKSLLFIALLGLTLGGCTIMDSRSSEVTAESEETQGVVVDGIPSLTVNHFAGVVTVRDGEAGHISATLTRQSHLADKAEAEAQLDKIVMTFSQSGTDVSLLIEGPEGFEGVGSLVTRPSADLVVTVPPGTELAINHGAGEVTVEEPDGDVAIDLGAGNATVTLPDDATFRLVVTGGVAGIDSDFDGVPEGGVATDIDATVGSDPTQTLTFNLGAGEVNLQKVR